MTTEIETSTDTKAEANNGQLGWIVSWSVPKSITLADLRTALVGAGFSEELAADMRNEHALRRAMKEMSDNRVIRKLRREEGKVFFQFTREWIEDQGATYAREAELCLNTETGVVTDDGSGEIARLAQTLLGEHLAKRLTSDLTRLVQRVYEAHKADLIPIRDQGFAYFVPSTHDDLVNKSRLLLNAIGGKLRSFAVRLGSAETSASVAESMADYFADLVKEFRGKVEKLNEDTRIDVRARRIESVSELRSKLECYRGLLGGLADQINLEISDAETAMLEALMRPATADSETDAALVA